MSSNTTAPAPKQVIYARTVADALFGHLEAAGTSVDRVTVIGEESFTPAKLEWNHHHEDLGLLVKDGFSEGSLVYVTVQPSRFNHDKHEGVLMVKMMADKRRAMLDLPDFLEFFETLNRESLAAPAPRNSVVEA